MLRIADLILGILHLLLLVFQFFNGIIHLPVDSIPDFLIQCVKFFLIQNHMQLLLDGTGGTDPGNTRDAFQLVHEGFIQKFRQLHIGHAFHGHRSHFHRKHRRVDLQNIRRSHHIIPGRRQRTDVLLNIHTNGIHIDRFLKLQHNTAVILQRSGRNLLDMLQGGHGLLHGPCDLCFHLLRACAGIGGHNHHVRKVHVGQQIRCHLQIRHHAQHQDRNYRHKNRQRLFNTEFRHNTLPFFH